MIKSLYLLRLALSVLFFFGISEKVVHADKNISLSTVFDVSGSMTNDWSYVKAGIIQMVNANQDRVKDFLVVPFNDPDFGPVMQTTNVAHFISSLETVRPSGGGDCPEYALSGIQLALKSGSENSLIFVFTDASAKDYEKINEIKALIQEKPSQITFIITGQCGHGPEDPGFKVFSEIAYSSGGLVYQIPHDDVKNMVSIMETAIKDDVVCVLTDDCDTAGVKNYNFSIDSSMTEFNLHVTISKVSSSMTIKVHDPKGNVVDESNGLVKILKSSSSAFVAVLKNPVAGMWSLTVSTTSDKHSVRIYALSEVDFFPRFSYRNDVSYDEALLRPVAGLSNSIYVKINGSYTINQLSVLRKNGTILAESTVKNTAEPNIFKGIEAVSFASGEIHYIKITGIDSTGARFQRYSTSIFIPMEIVTIKCPSSVDISNNVDKKNFNLECELLSPFKINLKTFYFDPLHHHPNLDKKNQIMSLNITLKDSNNKTDHSVILKKSRTLVFHLKTDQINWSDQLLDHNSTEFKKLEAEMCSLYQYGIIKSYRDNHSVCSVTFFDTEDKSVSATIELTTMEESITTGAEIEKEFLKICKETENEALTGCFLLLKKNAGKLILLNSNVALQTSTKRIKKKFFRAAQAIDGDCSKYYSRTKYEHQPIWWIDLEEEFHIHSISVKITNRKIKKQKPKISFMVSDTPPNVIERKVRDECFNMDTAIVSNKVALPCDRQGRFFSIMFDGYSVMEICNLELHGYAIN